jgi:AraC-like DNA-binding protein
MPTKILTALQTDLANADTTESKLRAYHQLVDFLVTKNPLLAEQYMDEGLEFAKKVEKNTNIAFFIHYKIILYGILNNSKKLFETNILFAEALKNVKEKSIYYLFLAETVSYLSRNREKTDITEYVLATRLKALELIDTNASIFFEYFIGKNIKYVLLHQISFSLVQLGIYEEGEEYLELLNFFVQLKKINPESIFLNFYWADFYYKTKKAELCIEYVHKALMDGYNMFGEASELDMSTMQLYIMAGLMSMDLLQKHEDAKTYFEKAIKICIFFNLSLNLGYLYRCVARLHKKMENWQLAYEYAEKASQAFLEDINKHANQNASLAQEILEDCYIQTGILEDFVKQKMQKPQQLAAENEHLQYAQYIQTHCVNPRLTVQDIAQHFNMSAKSLNRQIQKFFGLSVQKIIIFLRLQKAHQLLSDTQKSVTEVAEMVGFEHIPYFGICFKKQYGILPSKLKQSKK